MSDTLILNGSNLTLEDLYDVVYHGRKVQIDPDVIPRVKAARQVLFDLAATGPAPFTVSTTVLAGTRTGSSARTFSSNITATSSTATLWASPPTAAWRRSGPCCASA